VWGGRLRRGEMPAERAVLDVRIGIVMRALRIDVRRLGGVLRVRIRDGRECSARRDHGRDQQ
jgi:hypothetical protein